MPERFVQLVDLSAYAAPPARSEPRTPPRVPQKEQMPPPRPKQVTHTQPKPVSHPPKPTTQSISKPEPPINKTPPKPKPAPAPKRLSQPAPPKQEIKISTELVTRDAAPVPPKPSSTVSKPIDTETLKKRLENKLSAVGVSNPDSTSNPASHPDASGYHALIKETVKSHWRRKTSTEGLEAFLSIRIRSDGTLIFLGVKKSSGDLAFDASVIEAVKAVGKLPAPLPTGLGSPDYKVTINFR